MTGFVYNSVRVLYYTRWSYVTSDAVHATILYFSIVYVKYVAMRRGPESKQKQKSKEMILLRTFLLLAASTSFL